MTEEKVKMTQALYEFTSQEHYQVPMYRFIGQEQGFAIVNNLNKDQIKLPIQALDSLLEQMTKYKTYLEKFNKDKQEVLNNEE